MIHRFPYPSFDARSLIYPLICAAVMLFNPGAGWAQPVDAPIVQKPFEHEGAQYGYHPDYATNIPSFDSQNRPYIRSRAADRHVTGYIHTLRGGEWIQLDFESTIRRAYPDFQRFNDVGGWQGGRVVFDEDDHLYSHLQIVRSGRVQNILLYSSDYGESFQIYDLPAGQISMEHWTGHNSLSQPPLIANLQVRADHPLGKWTDYNNMSLIQPLKTADGQLSFVDPVLVTGNALHITQHSGQTSFAASASNGKTYITWAEVTDTNDVPGTPTYVATFDPMTGQVSARQFVGYGGPPNDGHNTPGLVLDSQGYLHVATGAHGQPFQYSRSIEPLTTDTSFTDPAPMLTTGRIVNGSESGQQTYLGMVAGPDDQLHAVFRQWRQGKDPYFEGKLFGGLVHLDKPEGEDWADESQLLVVPPTDGYSIYYHKLSIDRLGRLFVAYSYRSDAGLYYEHLDGLYHYQALLMSADGGLTWQLASTDDFAAGVIPEPTSLGLLGLSMAFFFRRR